jgi:hypothetical protein
MNPSDFPQQTVTGGETKITESQLESLGLKLREKFTVNETLRNGKELEWLEDLRMLNGIYDPDVLKKIGNLRSKAYPKVARSKTVSVEARLHEITDPDIGKPWAISPSPDATIPPEAMQMIIDQLVQASMMNWQTQQSQNQQAMQTGQPPPFPDLPTEPPMPEDIIVQAAFQEYAKQACKKMEVEIEDQFLDTKFKDKKKKALRSGLQLGTGIIKGPLVKTKEVKTWVPENGTYVLKSAKVPMPHIEYVRLWDYYPDMTVSEADQCEGHFERHVMTKHDVRKLTERPDFRKDVINEYLLANPDGDCIFKHWELELQNISTADGQTKKGRKYEVPEYWGYADAKDLQECGVIVSEDLLNEELQVNIWLIGNRVIKAVLNQTPKAEQPYHIFYFEKDETSIFGKGISRIMRDSQINICAATRMMLDNGAITAGPNVEINTDLMDDNQDFQSIHQFKLWLREGQSNTAGYPALRFYNFESHTAEYMSIIKQFLDFADLETAFPTYMLIEPASAGNETAQGASIRSGTVNITVKDVAKNFDDFNSSILEGFYSWNMEFNPDESIKGDYAVEAKGLSSLVAKEVRAQILTQNTVILEKYKAWVKEREYLEELWKALDMPMETLRTQEEHDLWLQQNSNPEAMQAQIDMVQAQIEEMKSKSLKNLAMAKKQNVAAIKEATTSGEAKATPPGAPIPSPEETQSKIDETNAKTVKHLASAHKDEVAAEMLKKQPVKKEGKTA